MKQFSPRKILVPLDFSEFSREALEAASDVAKLREADLVLLHVMEDLREGAAFGEGVAVYLDWDKVRDEIQRDAEARLEEARKSVGDRARVEARKVWGDPAHEVVRVAKGEGMDLIVMSTHGRTGLSRLIMGSVAEQVVRHSPCPVLIMRSQE